LHDDLRTEFWIDLNDVLLTDFPVEVVEDRGGSLVVAVVVITRIKPMLLRITREIRQREAQEDKKQIHAAGFQKK